MKNILITGAAGYIGSVCTYRLLQKGYKITAFDNLSTGHIETIERLKQYGDLNFIEGDLKNFEDINSAFKNKIDMVIHFASYSQIKEGEDNPDIYYINNVAGSINLFNAMVENKADKIVFSSSASVYGDCDKNPISEDFPKNPCNVYGKTKLMIENILSSLSLKSVKLRYFNVCGASKDYLFGEWHKEETHLIPNIISNKNLKIFGNDYNTKDGTCIRDYIDVEDVVQAHILACEYLNSGGESTQINLGSEIGYSVLDVIKLCEDVTNKKIKYEIYPKRQGDCAILTASNKKAREILNWKTERTLKDSIKSAYKFQNDTLKDIISKLNS